MSSTEQLRPLTTTTTATTTQQNPNGSHENASSPTTATTPPPPPLSTRTLILILLALNLSIFCVALMNVIISVALPSLTASFHTIANIGWYGAAYLLPTSAFQPHYGKLYARYPAKATILAALALFELGVLVSAVATGPRTFIVGRAVAGVGAAGVYSGVLFVVAVVTPGRWTPAVQSSVGVVIGVASVVAPLLGGWLTDRVGWKMCFFVNIPGGIIAAAMLLVLLKLPPVRRESKTKYELVKMFDPVGTVLFLGSIVCLLLALEWAGTSQAWSSIRIILLLVASGILFVLFVCVQLCTGDNGTIPVRIFRQRTIASLSFFIFCLFGQFACDLYFIPLYFQTIRGTTATGSGVNMIALIAAMVVALIATGIFCAKSGHYIGFFYASTVFMALGNGFLTTLKESTTPALYIGCQMFVGIGTGLALQLPATAVQAVLSPEDLPIGLATVLFFEFLGGAVAVAVGTNILVNKLSRPEGNGTTGPTLTHGANTTSTDESPVDGPLEKSAYMEALRWPLRLSLILACLSILGVVALERKRVQGRSKPGLVPDQDQITDGTVTSFELKETAQAPSPRGSGKMPCYGCHDRPQCFLHSPPATYRQYPEKHDLGVTRVKDFTLPRVPE